MRIARKTKWTSVLKRAWRSALVCAVVLTCMPDPRSHAADAPVTVKQMAAGAAHTVVLTSSNELWTWGTASLSSPTRMYSLGLGQPYGSPGPVRVPFSGGTIDRIAAGEDYTVVLADNRVWTWGDNSAGELGRDTAASPGPYVPAKAAFPDGVAIASVSAGEDHVLALDTSGGVWSWGDNSTGELGIDSTDANATVPVRVQTMNGGIKSDLGGIRSVHAGEGFSIAVAADGSVYSWGDGYGGARGDGSALYSSPVRIATKIDSGIFNNPDEVFSHWDTDTAFALKTDGGVKKTYAWGNGWSGQLGLGVAETLASRTSTPTEIATPAAVKRVYPSSTFAILLGEDGRLYAAGKNEGSALGALAAGTPHTTFTDLVFAADLNGDGVTDGSGEKLTGIADLAVGSMNVFAVNSSGAVVEWGRNDRYNLGLSHTAMVSVPVPMPALSGSGLDYGGKVVNPSTGLPAAGVDVQLYSSVFGTQMATTGTDGSFLFRNVAAGEHTIETLGTAPDNHDHAELTVDITASRTDANLFYRPTIVQVAAGDKFTLALTLAGDVWSWGTSDGGVLGRGAAAGGPLPGKLAFPGDAKIIQVAAGAETGYAVDTEGRLWAWGSNADGQFGSGSFTSSDSPVLIHVRANAEDSDAIVTAVAAGFNHVLALDSNGNVWSAGNNYAGKLGYATTGTLSAVPRKVVTAQAPDSPLAGISRIAAGRNFSLAVSTDGKLYSWGENIYGQLGRSSVSELGAVQVAMPDDDPVTDAFTGWSSAHAFALGTSGSLYGWGENTAKQLGTGSASPNKIYAPAAIAGFMGNVVRVAAGDTHSLLQTTDGRLYGTGTALYVAHTGSDLSAFDKLRLDGYYLGGATAFDAGDSNGFAVRYGTELYAWGVDYGGNLGSEAHLDGQTDALTPVHPFRFVSDPEPAPLPKAIPLPFHDANPEPRRLSGTLSWTAGGDETDVTGYELLYTDVLGVPLDAEPIASVAKGSAYAHTFADEAVPAEAHGIGIFTNDASGPKEILLLSAVDIGLYAPNVAPFTDSHPEARKLSGTLTWTAGGDETHVTGYQVLFTDLFGQPIGAEPLASVAKGEPYSVAITADTVIPEDAAGIGVFTNHSGGPKTFKLLLELDHIGVIVRPSLPVPVLAPFADSHPEARRLSGTLTWTAGGDETHVTGYQLIYTDASDMPIGMPFASIAKGSAYAHTFAGEAVPAEAYGIGLFTNDASGPKQILRLSAVDFIEDAAPEPVLPAPLLSPFVDRNVDAGKLSGTLVWTAGGDEAHVSAYRVVYADVTGTPLVAAPLATVAKGSPYRFTFTGEPAVPAEAAGLMVFAIAASGAAGPPAVLSLAAIDTTEEQAHAYLGVLRGEVGGEDGVASLGDIVRYATLRQDVTGDGTFGPSDVRFLLRLLALQGT